MTEAAQMLHPIVTSLLEGLVRDEDGHHHLGPAADRARANLLQLTDPPEIVWALESILAIAGRAIESETDLGHELIHLAAEVKPRVDAILAERQQGAGMNKLLGMIDRRELERALPVRADLTAELRRQLFTATISKHSASKRPGRPGR